MASTEVCQVLVPRGETIQVCSHTIGVNHGEGFEKNGWMGRDLCRIGQAFVEVMPESRELYCREEVSAE